MKQQRPEPAEPLLTLTPSRQTTLEAEGFIGALYRPQRDQYPGKALVMVGGTDGLYSLTRLIAEQFAKRGLTVLALAYWNRPGLPMQCSHIPLETGERAALWLKERGYEKIGIWGISLGAVFAMLCGVSFPELYSCVVGVSPCCVCGQGIQVKNAEHKQVKLCEGSAFSLRGEDIPWAPLRFDKKQVLKDALRYREYHLRSCYEDAIHHASAQLPVEKLNGPLLLLAAEPDAVWPSKESADLLVQRLKERGFAHPVEYAHYPFASHYLLPYTLRSRKMFRIERKEPERCAASNAQAFEKTLAFLQNQW